MRTQKQIEAVIKDLARMASNSKDKNLKVMLSLGISYLKWVLGEDSIDSFVDGLIKNGFNVVRKQIPTDFIIWTDDKPIMAERKTCSDLARSIKDASIWEQLKAMDVTDRKDRYVLLEDYNWRGFFELAICSVCTRKTYRKLCPKCGNKTIPIVKMNRHSIVATTSDI